MDIFYQSEKANYNYIPCAGQSLSSMRTISAVLFSLHKKRVASYSFSAYNYLPAAVVKTTVSSPSSASNNIVK